MSIQKGKGGIQPGSTVFDSESLKIDRDLKLVRDQLTSSLKDKFPRLSCQKKIKVGTYPFLTPCEPDGGLWFYDGILIAVFEAKKQQDLGNAIERWYKNNYVANYLNSKVSYVTFCRGEGAYPTGQIGKILDIAHPSWNQFNKYGNSCWLSCDGFSFESIRNIMEEILSELVLDFKK
jgi:hypothetical protein